MQAFFVPAKRLGVGVFHYSTFSALTEHQRNRITGKKSLCRRL